VELSLLRLLLRAFSFLFHGLLALFLLVISSLALSSGSQKLNLKMLPWTGDTLTFVVFFASLFGLFTLILALGGKARALFFVWSLAVAVLMLKGYVFSGYYFSHGEVKTAGGLLLGAWIAVVGAWPPRRRPRY
jgi:hypothetical protein